MSLNQELKDFLAGWQGVNKIMGQYDDSTYKKARTRLTGKQMGLVGANTAIAGQKLKDLQDPQLRAAELDEMRSRTRSRNASSDYQDWIRAGRPGEAGATAPGAIDPSSGIGTYTPPEGYAQGGLVRKPKSIAIPKGYEEGGLVTADEEYEDTDDTGEDANYGGLSATAGKDATREGLLAAQQQAGMIQQAGVRQPANVAGYLKGSGAAGPILTEAVLNKVDPGKKLSESQRNMAGLSAVYQFYMNKGMPEQAKRAAAALVQQNRQNAYHYAAIAKAALDQGDAVGAAKAATKAYANVPMGKDLKFEVDQKTGRITATATDDETGKVISKKIMSPQEMGGHMLKIRPEHFDQAVAEAAGMKPEKKKEVKPPKALSVSEQESVRGAMDEEFKRTTTGDETGKPRYEVTKGQEDALGNVATQIRGDNPRLSTQDAATVAHGLIYGRSSGAVTRAIDDTGAKRDVVSSAVRVNPVKTNEDGSRVIRPFGDEREVTVSRDAWLQSVALQGKNFRGSLEKGLGEAGVRLGKERETAQGDASREKIRAKMGSERRTRAEQLRQGRTAMGDRMEANTAPATQAMSTDYEE